MAGYRQFVANKRYWWMKSKRQKLSTRHRKAHYKGPKFEHLSGRNRPKGPL